MALSLAQFTSQENSAGGQTVPISATQAGDYIAILSWVYNGSGGHSVTGVTSNLSDTAVSQNINGAGSPFSHAGGTEKNYLHLMQPTVGVTSVTVAMSSVTFDTVAVFVIRGATNLVLDQSIAHEDVSAVTLYLSGLTGTLAAAAEFAIGWGTSSANMNNVNTSQTGSSGFSQDQITGNGHGFSHQITAATTALQSAWDGVSGVGSCMVHTFQDAPLTGKTPYNPWPQAAPVLGQ